MTLVEHKKSKNMTHYPNLHLPLKFRKTKDAKVNKQMKMNKGNSKFRMTLKIKCSTCFVKDIK